MVERREFRESAGAGETMHAADDGLMRTSPLDGLGLHVGDEVHLSVGGKIGRYALVGTEADGSVFLWKYVAAR